MLALSGLIVCSNDSRGRSICFYAFFFKPTLYVLDHLQRKGFTQSEM